VIDVGPVVDAESPAPTHTAIRISTLLLVVLGELLVIAICVVGVVTVAGWIGAGFVRRSGAPLPS
jgi:hypothetical protein